MDRTRVPLPVRVLLTLLLTLPCLGTQCETTLLGPTLQLRDLQAFDGIGYCRDWGLGEYFHPDQTCHRLEGCLFNCPQVCEDSAGRRVNSRDLVSPVIGTDQCGRCIYDTPWDPWTGFTSHMALWGHTLLDVLLAPFTGLDR
jgi:hypothetical protein